jgi:uncharacterized RDD family membrane protein YckC
MKHLNLLHRRMLAASLDFIVVLAINTAVYFKFAEPNEVGVYELPGIYVFILMVFNFLYYPIAEGLTGQTIFKMVFGIKAVTERGKEPSIWTSFKRHLFDVPDYFFCGLVAIIVAKRSPNQKRIGDIIAHSVVVLENEETAPISQPSQLTLPSEQVPIDSFVKPQKAYAFRRMIGFIIDYTVWFLLVIGYSYLNGGSVQGWHAFIVFIFAWFIAIVVPEGTLGYTLGKGLFNLRVVSEKKDRNLLVVSFVRHLFDFIELCLLAGIVSLILIKSNNNHQRIGDIVAGSFVVYDDR